MDFKGCRWHGHYCQKDRHVKDPDTGLSLKELYRITMLREQKIKEALDGRYLTIWECEFDSEVRNNEEVQKFIKNLDIPTPLAIRDALYGGRSEPFYCQYDCQEGEKIRYLDFCVSSSLLYVFFFFSIPQPQFPYGAPGGLAPPPPPHSYAPD